MSEAEVLNLVGSPTNTINVPDTFGIKSKSLLWKNSQGEFTVTLLNDKVISRVSVGSDGKQEINMDGFDFNNFPIPQMPNMPDMPKMPNNPFNNRKK